MNGVLVIDKPAGPTSHDVVARVRRLTGLRRVGHTGTLDPMATGILPLVLGRATRLARFMSGGAKCYEARVRLGWETDTYDATGRRVTDGLSSAPTEVGGVESPGAIPTAPLPDRVAIEAALESFRGTHDQQPPAFSAKKINGVRAYRLARSNAGIAPKPVSVAVHHLSVTSFHGDEVDLDIVCSAGFYVRALAHDLGRRLGCGGHLTSLRRIRSGDFGMDRAVPLAQLERDAHLAQAACIPLEELLPSAPSIMLNTRGTHRAAHGQSISEPDVDDRTPFPPPDASFTAPGGSPVVTRVFGPERTLLAIGEYFHDTRILRPVVVLV